MITLSDRLWEQVHGAMETVGFNEFDMDLVNNLPGDTVMMLSGEYVTLNSHWEDWNLPKWYHPHRVINMTTVKIINDMAKNVLEVGKREELDATAPIESVEAKIPVIENGIEAMTDDFPMAIQTAPFLPAPTAPPTFLPPPKILNTGKETIAIRSPRFPAQHPL